MTCHAAIVSRELGIPCVVGTGDATTKLRDGEVVTVDASHGVVLEGARAAAEHSAAAPPARAGRTGRPGDRHEAARQPLRALAGRARRGARRRRRRPAARRADGHRGARGHPSARCCSSRAAPRSSSSGWPRRSTAFAAGFAPRPITYRTIDFRTNEFRGLRGRRPLRARGGQPDDRLPRRAPLHARRRRLPPRARRDPPGLGRRPHELPRDAAVRAHRARAASAAAT